MRAVCENVSDNVLNAGHVFMGRELTPAFGVLKMQSDTRLGQAFTIVGTLSTAPWNEMFKWVNVLLMDSRHETK